MFSKKYIEDKDLDFLSKCNNDDLRVFADMLVYDKDNEMRYAEFLSKNRLFKLHYPNELNLIYKELIHEFQLYGGDSVINFFRGHGVTYRQILKEVCDKKKVNYSKTTSVEKMEMYLIQKLLDDTLDEMDEEQLREAIRDLQIDSKDCNNNEAMKNLLIVALMSPKLVSSLLQFVAKSLMPSLFGKAVVAGGLGRVMGSLIPAINIVMTAWLVKDFTGPAFRVTLPGVILIISMRHKLDDPKEQNE